MDKNKKIIITILVMFSIVLIGFYFHFSNKLIRQLHGPLEGVDSIMTFDNNLYVISKDNHIFTWQWDNLKRWPIVAKPQASCISAVAADKIIYNPSNSDKLILTDLKAEQEIANLSLPIGSECKKIKISPNGKFGISLLNEKDQSGLAFFDNEFKDLKVAFQKNIKEEKINIEDIAISNDANLIVGAGKKDKAWIFIKDIKNDKILWEKTFDEYSQFSIVDFSPDGKTIYVAEKIRFILAIDSITGNILRTYEMPVYQTPAHQKQNISSVAISPDGKILAVDTEPARTIWFWEISTGKKIDTLYANDFTVSDIAFSPDSKYLATGCLVRPEIKIWKVPQSK